MTPLVYVPFFHWLLVTGGQLRSNFYFVLWNTWPQIQSFNSLVHKVGVFCGWNKFKMIKKFQNFVSNKNFWQEIENNSELFFIPHAQLLSYLSRNKTFHFYKYKRKKSAECLWKVFSFRNTWSIFRKVLLDFSTQVGVFFGWNKFKVIKKSAIAYRVPQGKLYLFRRS